MGVVCMLILLFLSFCFHLVASNGLENSQYQYQICGTTKSGHALAIPTEVKCLPPKSDANVTKTTVKIWVPRSDPLVQVAYKCWIRTRTICTHMSFFGGKGIVGDITENQAVDIISCQLALSDFPKLIRKFLLTEIYSGIWSTNNTLTVEYVWCCNDHCATVRNLFIEQGQIATFDGVHLSSSLGDIGGCIINSGYCEGNDGTIVWQPFNDTSFCPYQAMEPTYNAIVSDEHIIVHELQAAFSISHSALTESDNCNLKFGFTTQQGPIFVF